MMLSAPVASRRPSADARDGRTRAQPWSSPYLAGVGVGLVLLLAYVIVGRGLGASGAFSKLVASGVTAAAPAHAAANPAVSGYIAAGSNPFRDWLVIEIIGVTLGGLFSALAAGRFSFTVERGPRIGDQRRLALAFAGGLVMAFGAKLARGCTSGLALSGGALLSVGAWVFVVAAFAAGYAFAPFVRRQWT
ncbi:MAG: YeeE/YedE thiosulfate transporter family protein [Gemmatimonadota bacterium]|jgi:hypothetical protein